MSSKVLGWMMGLLFVGDYSGGCSMTLSICKYFVTGSEENRENHKN